MASMHIRVPRCVEVWLEGDDLGVLFQHGECMEFLAGSIGDDVDVGAVAEAHTRTVGVFRLVPPYRER